LEAHGVKPSKGLGQNFVIDPNTIRKMVAVADIGPGDRVLEIGAGAGSLTIELARAAREVVAVEADAALLPVLQETLRGRDNVQLIHADALRLDLSRLGATKLVANLPYNIAATVVLATLQQARRIDHITVMTQKEVGERLAANPGSKAYGQASVLRAFHADARLVMRVSRRAFYPVPNVDSVVIHLTRRLTRPDVDESVFGDVVRAAFSQRRKTLRNSLATLTGSAGSAERALRAAGINQERRAETLTVDEFSAVAERIRHYARGRSPPADL